MTIWDNIYKNYQKGGKAWATLSEGLIPQFVDFVEKSKFTKCRTFDIGCGNGKYITYLQEKGFQVSGIDSSETAITMAKEKTGNSNIECANMFEYEIPVNTYDFIFSISTIHHGFKKDVQALIDKIYTAALHGGKIFITLPDFESSKHWNTFKNNQELAPGTYAPLSGPEKGLAHSFYTKEEIVSLFSQFNNIEMELDGIGRWIITAEKNL